MNELLQLSGTRLAALIRTGQLTSREVVEMHIDHVERVNPDLNAIVKDRFAEARREAHDADVRTRASAPEDLPPFHGVPCSIKECFAFRGMPNTSGLIARKSVAPVEDATAVARLRAAGAIPLGVTNVSELCMWMETNNRVYGRTNNPYDPSRVVGGSSGGEGAIIGAGGVPFGLGSDIGGSIRMPAFFNGVFGHKPTGGLVPSTGQYPAARNEAARYLTTGPLARRAEDLFPLLRVLAGPDGKDAACEARQLGDPDAVLLKDLTVIDIHSDGVHRVSDDLQAAQVRAGLALTDAGARLSSLTLAPLRHSLEIWSSSMGAAGGESFAELLGDGTAVPAFGHLLRWPFRRTPHTLPAIILALVEKIPGLMPARARRFVAEGQALKQDLIERLGPHGVLLYPSYPEPAPRHFKPLMPPFNWVYTAILNILEFPVTQVPLGLNREGLPLGVQVAAIPGNDHVTIAVAQHLERKLGGWTPPPRLH